MGRWKAFEGQASVFKPVSHVEEAAKSSDAILLRRHVKSGP